MVYYVSVCTVVPQTLVFTVISFLIQCSYISCLKNEVSLLWTGSFGSVGHSAIYRVCRYAGGLEIQVDIPVANGSARLSTFVVPTSV